MFTPEFTLGASSARRYSRDMAHIVYDGKKYPLKDEQYAETDAAIQEVFRSGGWARMEISHGDGDKSVLYVSSSTPIVLNDWDLDALGS